MVVPGFEEPFFGLVRILLHIPSSEVIVADNPLGMAGASAFFT